MTAPKPRLILGIAAGTQVTDWSVQLLKDEFPDHEVTVIEGLAVALALPAAAEPPLELK